MDVEGGVLMGWVKVPGSDGEPATGVNAMPTSIETPTWIRQVGTFEGDVPDRAAALKLAAECASEAARSTGDRGLVWAAISRAWTDIAGVIPEPESEVPAAERIPASRALALYGADVASDTVTVRRCGHGCQCLHSAGHWVHPYTVAVCDDPPRGA
jgi:hypothetical protein